MPRIVIVAHRHIPFDIMRYRMTDFADIWREEGMDVRIQQGPADQADDDVAILHVDLTVVPADHVEYVRRFPVAVNAGAVDISKRRVSTAILRPDEDYSGPVIVKSNRNHHGYMEARLASMGLMPSRFARVPREYPIHGKPADVPPGVWSNPDLVVERFLPEHHDGSYWLRCWTFFGDKETHTLWRSYYPIVKADNCFSVEPGGDPPEDLRRIRRELGFDYGKFDYGIVDGRVVLYDANRTPAAGDFRFKREGAGRRSRILAEGIKWFLRSAPARQGDSPRSAPA